jgi:16S rRNA (guanine1207-N2)-methyltransferase
MDLMHSSKLPVVANNLMSVAQGEFELQRNPPDEFLRAWDAADEYLLRQVDDLKILSRQSSILIVNDTFGALSIALADSQPLMMSDSYLAQQATTNNLLVNGLETKQVAFDNGLHQKTQVFDLVLIKIPKSLAMLEHQLYNIRSSVRRGTRIIGAGMSRTIHKSTLQLFEDILGPTTTSLARKKSRLIYVTRDESMNEGQSPYPDYIIVEADREYTISSHANVFSRDRLDNGSRLLIENMPTSEQYRQIVDLGCGNGLLGIIAASLNPESEVLFSDESYMAVESARQNFINAFGKGRQANFEVTNCLQGVDAQSKDLVLNNPPFHQQNATGDSIAWQMFVDARRVLKPGGELWVVGNRHLGYHAKLKKLFGNCVTTASNSKFVILTATRNPGS